MNRATAMLELNKALIFIRLSWFVVLFSSLVRTFGSLDV
jgi:hypothetical protein